MFTSKLKLISVILVIVLASVAAWGCAPAPAPTPKPTPKPEWAPPKPEMLVFASYEIGGTAYIVLSALNEGFLTKFNVRARGIPVGSGVSRMNFVRLGEASALLTTDDLYASEGLYDFASVEWGPQPLRAAYFPGRDSAYSLATTKKTGIKTVADLKGKKVPWVIGTPSANLMYEAGLAFGGLTYDDVEKVELRSTRDQFEALISGKVDAATMDTLSSKAYEAEASPGGIVWIPFPKEDTEAWKRIQSIFPLYFPQHVTSGAGITEPIWLCSYIYPRFVTYADVDEGVIYWMVKCLVESYDEYKNIAPMMPPFALERSIEAHCTLPYHPGTIRYFKERGVWTPQLERNTQELLDRQTKLQALWEATMVEAAEKEVKAKEFKEFWLVKRAEKFPEFWKGTPVK